MEKLRLRARLGAGSDDVRTQICQVPYHAAPVPRRCDRSVHLRGTGSTHGMRFGWERGRALRSSFATAHRAGPLVRSVDLPIDLSRGRAASWATAVRKDVGGSARPLSVRLPNLIHMAMSHGAPVERRWVNRVVWRGS